MKLDLKSLRDAPGWAGAGVRVPRFDPAEMSRYTRESPVWLHFGAGNIFRGFIASLQQELLEQGLADRGIIAAETFDGSLPAFIAAFTRKKALSRSEIDEIRRMIDGWEEK